MLYAFYQQIRVPEGNGHFHYESEFLTTVDSEREAEELAAIFTAQGMDLLIEDSER